MGQKRLLAASVGLMLLLGGVTVLLAQDITPRLKPKAIDPRIDGFLQPKPSSEPGSPTSPPSCPETLDQPSREVCQAVIQEFFAYSRFGWQHSRRVFEWQLLSSKIIFFTVVGLVIAGIYFAWVQFRSGLARRTAESQESSQITEIEASAKGIRVSSPVLGVIILVISLAFFYLYLVFVYPIQRVF